MFHKLATVAQLADFDEIIDVRSPAEFAEDHVPGAINCPVLDDAERIEIGTLYKQVSPFAARRRGAVLVARHIATHIDTLFAQRPKSWRPLIHCWRGGQRSGAMATVLAQVGWDAWQLEGGYKAWRHLVLDRLDSVPDTLRLVVLDGPTGTGKTRLLAALARQGAQTIDLEALACHRGSVLGALPGQAQPPQKQFETALAGRLQALDPERPVFIEAESRRIGRLTLPGALFARLRAAPHLLVSVPMQERVRQLEHDYAHYLAEPDTLVQQLDFLKTVVSARQLEEWKALAAGGHFDALVAGLLDRHYDPLYLRARAGREARACPLDSLDEAALDRAARNLMAAWPALD